MEQVLKNILLTGEIGEQLLDPETYKLLEYVKILRTNNAQAKEALQEASKEQIQLNKDVLHLQEMLSLLQKLTENYTKDAEMELRGEKDMSSQIQGHLRHQLANTEALGRLQNSVEHLQNQIILREREIKDLEKTTNVDGHLLQELLDHLNNNEEDNLLLLRYTSADASEIKTLSVDLEKLSEKVAKAEVYYRECQGEANAHKTMRVHLVSSFLKEAERRDELLMIWETTLNDLKQKNKQETAIVENIFETKSRIDSCQKSRDHEDYLLRQIRSSVNEIEDYLSDIDEESKILSQKLNNVIEASYELRGQVSELETCCTKLKKDTLHAGDQIKATNEICKEKKAFLERLLTKCTKLEDDLCLETELLLSSEESLRALDTIKTENERQIILLEKQIAVIQNLKQRHLREILELEEKIRIERGLSTSLTTAQHRTKKDINKLQKDMMKTEHLIYKQELQIEEIKLKIYQFTHDDNNNPLNEDLKRVVDELRERLMKTNQNNILLQRTVPLLQSRILKSQKELDRKQTEVANIEEVGASLSKEGDAYEREKINLVKIREEVLVDASLNELYLQNRIQKLKAVEDELRANTRNRAEMEDLMKEEKKNILGEISATKTQNHDLEGRQSGLIKELHFVNTNISQLKEKFDRIRKALNGPDDEDITPMHVILEVAKEREGLQEAGDLLDNEVRKAETEVEGLQKILSHLSHENNEFRSTLHHLTYHGEEDAEKNELEKELQSFIEDEKVSKQNYERESKALSNARDRLREAGLQLQTVEELLREKDLLRRLLDTEIGAQTIKVKHASQACSVLNAKLAHKKLEIADIQLRVTQERLKMVTTLIADEIRNVPEMVEACVIYCQQEHVPPPTFSTLTKMSDYGSRSSLGSHQSKRGKRRSCSAPSGGVAPEGRCGSTASLNSDDSGSSSVASGIGQDEKSYSAYSRTHLNIPMLVTASRQVKVAQDDSQPCEASGKSGHEGRRCFKKMSQNSQTSGAKEDKMQRMISPDFPTREQPKAGLKGRSIEQSFTPHRAARKRTSSTSATISSKNHIGRRSNIES